MRGSQSRQQASKSRFIRRKSYGRSTGKKRKRFFTLISWQISEENFTTFVAITVLPSVSIRQLHGLPKISARTLKYGICRCRLSERSA